MARGWESKSVEMQMEDRETSSIPAGGNTHANARHERELAVLKLSRRHLLHELETMTNPRVRELKLRALSHIEARIAAAPNDGSEGP
ncbi:MAG: hypothetical protein ABUS49_05545 [Acidobacteriota bacterium]